ncbi:MAG: S9 family peptidase [Bacteroidia bacterium]|nr:S9 family peptidase [Bacteroidia bacterium]
MKKITGMAVAIMFFWSILHSVSAQTGKLEFSLEDMVNYQFSPQSVRGLKSMNDGEHYTTLEKSSKVTEFSYKTGDTVAVIFNIKDLKNEKFKTISDFQQSSDEKKIMFYIDRERIYRYSFTASYYVYDLVTKKLTPVSENGKQQLATFSPDGQFVAFVRQNDLFITDLNSGKETQVTADGKKNEIINGAPDWVYEEEFGFSRAYEWSPDSRYLAFMRFDESKVHEFNMTMYAGSAPTIKENELYPENRVFKYPKAGEANSVVSIHVYDTGTKKIIKMDVGTETDQYIPRIRWTKLTSTLGILRLNRLQNKLDILFANAGDGKSKVIFTEENKYFIDEQVFNDIKFLDDKKQFTITSEKDGWNHIYLYNFEKGTLNQVTSGKWDVTDFIGVDEKNKLVYFESSETSPLKRDLYCIRFNGKDKKKLTSDEGTNNAEFSSNYKYFVNNFSNVSVPAKVTVCDNNGKLIRMIEDNRKLNDTLKYYHFNNRELFSFKTSENVDLNGWMIKPPGFDPAKYSGPNSQEVRDSWGLSWENYIAQKGYIIVCVDGRGTGGRGEEFRKMTYKQLGKFETIDQVEAAKYMGSLPFVDKNRIGIWGWSYGGFISASCMVKGNGVFKAGIAVAPVTNWRFYDNIYTETYMRTPQENPKGYD